MQVIVLHASTWRDVAHSSNLTASKSSQKIISAHIHTYTCTLGPDTASRSLALQISPSSTPVLCTHRHFLTALLHLASLGVPKRCCRSPKTNILIASLHTSVRGPCHDQVTLALSYGSAPIGFIKIVSSTPSRS